MSIFENLHTPNLPIDIYSTEQIREFEQAAMNEFSFEETEFMRRAAEAAYDHLEDNYSDAEAVIIFCGPGNNGGDGYYLAKLAQQADIETTIYYFNSPETLTGAACWAYQQAKEAGVTLMPFEGEVNTEADLVVDAIFGIGLSKPIEGAYLQAVEWMNDNDLPVMSIDIPSGICSETGSELSQAVVADSTITFIGLKKGLLTGEAVDHVGDLVCDDLDLPAEIFLRAEPYAVRLDHESIVDYLLPRNENCHKGDFGHVLIIGGDYGMAGAVTMAANAALRAGAGLVTVVTRQEHVAAIVAYHPEVMAIGHEHVNLPELLDKASLIVVGPGLGRSAWSEELFLAVSKTDKPLVIDADGLYFLKQHTISNSMILTPHPGEAGQLLDLSTDKVQADRYRALQTLKQRFETADIVLKGAGSLLLDDNGVFSVCCHGNPGMATAGMGDILTGVIAGLWAQGLDKSIALELGVLIHALAADVVAQSHGERGMMATDLLPLIQPLVNSGDAQDNDIIEEFLDEDIED